VVRQTFQLARCGCTLRVTLIRNITYLVHCLIHYKLNVSRLNCNSYLYLNLKDIQNYQSQIKLPTLFEAWCKTLCQAIYMHVWCRAKLLCSNLFNYYSLRYTCFPITHCILCWKTSIVELLSYRFLHEDVFIHT
jgi:hypothetical protein